MAFSASLGITLGVFPICGKFPIHPFTHFPLSLHMLLLLLKANLNYVLKYLTLCTSTNVFTRTCMVMVKNISSHFTKQDPNCKETRSHTIYSLDRQRYYTGFLVTCCLSDIINKSWERERELYLHHVKTIQKDCWTFNMMPEDPKRLILSI